MQPTFTRFNTAVHHTIEYYSTSLMVDYFMFFAGTPTWRNEERLKSWYEFVLSTHEMMEDEINQVIVTTNQNTHAVFFKMLKDWLTDYRTSVINTNLILERLEEYNERETSKFEEIVNKKTEEHRKNTAQWLHLEEYEVEMEFGGALSLMPQFSKIRGVKIKQKKVNYRYYCVADKHEIVDTTLIEKYMPIIGGILRNFNSIIKKYIQLYDDGKIIASTTLLVSTASSPTTPNLLNNMEQPEAKKLHTNLSVPQIAFLFKLLFDAELIKPDSDADLLRFISQNFTTKATSDKGISTNGINNVYYSPDNKTISFWIKEFRQMIINSQSQL